MFGDEQNGAAPLAADGEALDEAQHHQQGRGPVPDLRERRQAAHEEGGGAHQQQAELQQPLASVPISELAEDDAADRAGREADGVGHEGGKDGVELVGAFREEHLVEYQRGRGAVEEELVPFDDGAGHGRGHHSAKVRPPAFEPLGPQLITHCSPWRNAHPGL